MTTVGAFMVAWAALLVFGLALIGATSLAEWLMRRRKARDEVL